MILVTRDALIFNNTHCISWTPATSIFQGALYLYCLLKLFPIYFLGRLLVRHARIVRSCEWGGGWGAEWKQIHEMHCQVGLLHERGFVSFPLISHQAQHDTRIWQLENCRERFVDKIVTRFHDLGVWTEVMLNAKPFKRLRLFGYWDVCNPIRLTERHLKFHNKLMFEYVVIFWGSFPRNWPLWPVVDWNLMLTWHSVVDLRP